MQAKPILKKKKGKGELCLEANQIEAQSMTWLLFRYMTFASSL